MPHPFSSFFAVALFLVVYSTLSLVVTFVLLDGKEQKVVVAAYVGESGHVSAGSIALLRSTHGSLCVNDTIALPAANGFRLRRITKILTAGTELHHNMETFIAPQDFFQLDRTDELNMQYPCDFNLEFNEFLKLKLRQGEFDSDSRQMGVCFTNVVRRWPEPNQCQHTHIQHDFVGLSRSHVRVPNRKDTASDIHIQDGRVFWNSRSPAMNPAGFMTDPATTGAAAAARQGGSQSESGGTGVATDQPSSLALHSPAPPRQLTAAEVARLAQSSPLAQLDLALPAQTAQPIQSVEPVELADECTLEWLGPSDLWLHVALMTPSVPLVGPIAAWATIYPRLSIVVWSLMVIVSCFTAFRGQASSHEAPPASSAPFVQTVSLAPAAAQGEDNLPAVDKQLDEFHMSQCWRIVTLPMFVSSLCLGATLFLTTCPRAIS